MTRLRVKPFGTASVTTGCPTKDCDGSHYVDVDYDIAPAYRHYTGTWAGSDDCECDLTPELKQKIVEDAEQLVMLGEDLY